MEHKENFSTFEDKVIDVEPEMKRTLKGYVLKKFLKKNFEDTFYE